MELSCRAIEHEEDASGARVGCGLHAQTFDALAPQCVEVHFVFSIASVVGGVRAAGVDLVLEVGAFGGYGGDFLLWGCCELSKRRAVGQG